MERCQSPLDSCSIRLPCLGFEFCHTARIFHDSGTERYHRGAGGRSHQAVLGETPDTILQQTADNSPPMLRWNLIQTIKEETTATGFKKFFEVTGLNSKAVRRQTLYEKLQQYREMNLVAFPEEVRHIPT